MDNTWANYDMPHNRTVVVDERNRYQGVLDIEVLADVLKQLRQQAKKHYDDLAQLDAVDQEAQLQDAEPQ